MKLIIAEKPSLGMKIVSAIGPRSFNKEDGYFENNQFIVTWGFGHLFSLFDIEEYKGVSEDENPGWTLEGLPFKPETFQYGLKKKPGSKTVDSGVKKQFGIVKKLCQRKDVETVVSAGDADREGEIIIRIILDQADNFKPVMRLWLPDQTEESIQSALRNLKSDSLYDNLANEGYARIEMDWLYGINLTRLASLKSNSFLRVGRVITPIVEAIYDRDLLIRNFVPEKYIGMASKAEIKDQVIELNSKKTFDWKDRTSAEQLCQQYNAADAVVSDIKTEQKTIDAGHLFSESTILGFLGDKYKFSPKKSLDLLQKLYDNQFITYPRTNTEYLATAEREKMNATIAKLQAQGYEVCPKDKKKSIYDDSKIESHSALTPTSKLVSKDQLSDDEWRVYSAIFNRFVAVFCSKPCLVNRTTLTIDVGELEQFTLRGDVFVQRGWMEYEESNRKDRILPALAVGEKVETDFKLLDKQTKPPKHYTVKTLEKFLVNPFREQKLSLRDEDEVEEETQDTDNDGQISAEAEAEYKAMFEGIEIGTVATRPGIIDNAIKSEYISLKNNVYTILPNGEYYVETLRALGICIHKEKSAGMGRYLKQVYKGELSVAESVDYAFDDIRNLFDGTKGITVERSMAESREKNILGSCPLCGSDVIENAKAFSCSNKDCKLVFYKNDKFVSSLGKKMSAQLVKSLLSKRKALLHSCTSQKTGKKFDCILLATISSEGISYKIEFPKPEDNSPGECPVCHSMIVENSKAFSCSNEQCGVVFFKEGGFVGNLGKKMTASIVKSLITKGEAPLNNCKSTKTGKTFDCILVVDFTSGKPEYSIRFPEVNELSLGDCPNSGCGGQILKDRFGNYSCSNWKDGCKFKINGTVAGKTLSRTNVKALLTKGKTSEIDGFKSSKGKTFEARLVLGENGNLSFEFPQHPHKK